MAVLHVEELEAYRRDGFVRVEEAIPRALADRCRQRLWEALPEDPDDPSTWTRPVVRVYAHTAPELHEAARSPRWVEAIGEVAGPDAAPVPWLSGTTAIRFPVDGDPGDDGWHVEGSYAGPDGGWWVNHRSRGRALLMLVLLSEVGEHDAPTRLRVGSHAAVPELLRPAGAAGVPALAFTPPPELHDLPLALATGRPGDVYLCHPFLVHAAQRNQGATVRFVAQPGVPWRDGVPGFPA
jgi:hypothetical protein